MKFALFNDVVNFSWDQLASAFWLRYPNPKSSHVVAVDTFHHQVSKDGTLLTKRIIKKRNSFKLPAWGDAIAPKFIYVIEESVVDPRRQTIVSYTRNITSTSVCVVDEKCSYRPGADKSTVALYKEVYIKSPMRFIGSAIQGVLYNRYKSKTAPESTAGFVHVLTQIFRPWELPEDQRPAAKAKELLKESAQKFKESKEKSKEKLLESKEKLKETAQLAKERSKDSLYESRAKMKENLHESREKMKENIYESREKIKEKAKDAAKLRN